MWYAVVRGLPGSGPGQQLRSDFFQQVGSSRHKRNTLSNGRAVQKKGRRIILRVSPGQQNKNEIFKSTDKSLIMNLI